MISLLNQHGFVVSQFAGVTIPAIALVILFAHYLPWHAKVGRSDPTGVRLIAGKSAAYYLDTGHAPKTIDDLLSNSRTLPNWKGPYITEQQKKDPWGHDYIIRTPGLHGAIDVVSLGADGLVGGVGNDADVGSGGDKCK